MPVFSVRTRLIAVITVVAGLGMLAVGFVVYLEERGRILAAGRQPAGREPRLRPLPGRAGREHTGTWDNAVEALSAIVQRAAPDDNTGTVGIIDGAAKLVPGVPLDVDLLSAPGFVPHVVEVTSGGEPFVGTYAEEGVVWRFLGIPVVSTADPSTPVFAIAYDIEAELAELNAAARVWAIASAITLLVIAGAAAAVTTRLLRPLRQMRETAERVSGQALSERLPVVGRDDVSELARTMNDMLDRLDQALESQRRLLSDVGHELKTPITIVRGYLEVVDPDDGADVRVTRDLAVDELERMANLVQDLAATAALHGPSPIRPVPIDSADLLQQILRKAAGIEGAEIECGTVAAIVTALDPARVTQAVLQLAQNAVTHGGGRMEISSAVVGGLLELSVRDFGPGVPDDEKAQVFDRFVQGGHAGDDAGHGLRLNIVQVIARAHGGAARVADAPHGGAVFTIALPIVDAAVTAAPDLVIPPRPPLPARPTEQLIG